MPAFFFDKMDELKRIWTDRFVKVHPDRPELQRFANRIGRVITVNYSGKAIVDFQDGGWYDIPASEEYLVVIDPAEAQGKYDAKANSAQTFPVRHS
jgi:hypothetical protein